MQEHLLILNNLKIFYRTFGNSDKQPLVYLHGWGSPRNNILGKGTIDIMDKLSKEFYCIAIDLPGLIKSEPPKEIWNFDEYANFLKKFIEQIGIRTPFVLLGQSFGGGVATKYAFLYQDDLVALILTNSVLIDRTINWYYKLRKSLNNFLKRLIKNKITPIYIKRKFVSLYLGVHKATLKERKLENYKIMMDIAFNYNLTGDYTLLNIPVLMLWGKKDKNATLISDALKSKEKIKNVTFITLKGGHLGLFTDSGYATQKIIAFYKKIKN